MMYSVEDDIFIDAPKAFSLPVCLHPPAALLYKVYIFPNPFRGSLILL